LVTWPKPGQTKVLGRWAWDGKCYTGLVKGIGQVWSPGPNQAKPRSWADEHGMANVIQGL